MILRCIYMAYFLAVDIGASSGRHILGEVAGGKINCTEVYRFDNNFKELDGDLVWDIESLTENVIKGIAECKAIGKLPSTVAIDTWGVDYVLLDENEKEIMPCFSYRDGRTAGIPEEIDKIISKAELYAHTGIQRANYNTIYQLYCDKKSGKLDGARHFLMMPDYLAWRLTGVMKNEYTEATTTSLVNATEKAWDKELLDTLGIKSTIFKEISSPSTLVGSLKDDVKAKLGFDCEVVLCPSHDTASAIAACPLTGSGMYISSGTWSLIGAENRTAVLSDDALKANFTNEGGIDGSYLFLKNIMGMWLFQSIRRNLDKKYTYDEMMHMAEQSDFTDTFDPNDQRLTAPENMIDAVRECLGKPDLPLGDVINSVYHSLARSYKNVVDDIEAMTGERPQCLSIIGGGSKDSYLNRLTKEYIGIKTFAGPVEATALGNLVSQMMYLDSTLTLDRAREMIRNSFDITELA